MLRERLHPITPRVAVVKRSSSLRPFPISAGRIFVRPTPHPIRSKMAIAAKIPKEQTFGRQEEFQPGAGCKGLGSVPPPRPGRHLRRPVVLQERFGID